MTKETLAKVEARFAELADLGVDGKATLAEMVKLERYQALRRRALGVSSWFDSRTMWELKKLERNLRRDLWRESNQPEPSAPPRSQL